MEAYADQVYQVFCGFPGVDEKKLCDRMTCDWLAMVKGKNMPPFLKNPDSRQRQIAEQAERQLGRKIARGSSAVLQSGKGVFVDGSDRDPVTGLYRLYFI